MRANRRDESLFLFFGNFARGDPYARAGRSTRPLPGAIHTFTAQALPSFSTLIFKVSLPFFSKFYRSWSWKLPFFSKFYRSWKLPFFSKFYRSWKLHFHFPVISSAFPKISKKVSSWKERPKISKKVSSWKERRFLPFTTNFFQKNFQKFPKMLAAGNPIFFQILLQLENNLPLFSILSNKRIPKKR